ncbi:PQQ-dependent catabolism-associated CXXCW motif protein [uncultured Roseobacter sp.]|uniref:PQQ-dependent catabolism-associated CXXCW motif protein n=1 Tax=uncultured Roseobacter sp. TaxID=114847 RepID=UPI0026234785|nr:PQQ-dependent catabolism-associated CXXCW motif protein [uncultured Roseobacter sp.]
MIRALVAALFLLPLPALSQTVPEPGDYRMDHYRAPVPDAITGGTVVGPEQAFEMWEAGGAGFIDVMPQPPKPANLPKGTIWRDKPRYTIPGAVWLPNVGYGAIADVTADYFRAGLEKASGGNPDHPLVFFCLEDCWMSWNAARRALEWGYTSVFWLPEGTDGWQLWDYPVAKTDPEAGQPQTGN